MGLAGLKSRRQQGSLPSGGCGEDPVSLPAPASRGHLHSLALSLFFCLRSQRCSVFKSLSHSGSSSASLVHLEGPLWLHWTPLANQNNLFLLRWSEKQTMLSENVMPLLRVCSITYARVLGITMRATLRGLCQPQKGKKGSLRITNLQKMETGQKLWPRSRENPQLNISIQANGH